MSELFINYRTELGTFILSMYILIKIAGIAYRSRNLHYFHIYSVAMTLFTFVNLLTLLSDAGILFLYRTSAFILNFFYMVLICWGSFTWFRYEESVLNSNWMNTIWKKIVWNIPILVFVVLCAYSWKTSWIFSVDENGVYQRGTYWFLQFVFGYFYMMIAIVKTIFYVLFKKGMEDRVHKALVHNSAIVFIGSVMQLFYAHSYVAIAATIGMVVSYIELCTTEEHEIKEHIATARLLHETQIQKEALQLALDNYKQADYDRRTDFLTGLRNRQDMFELLQDSLSGKRALITTMYMMDIDNFKTLNDRYGHTYGDECLQRIGKALNEYGNAHDIVFYRYGGEEMLGIGFGPKEEAEARAKELVELIFSLQIKRDDAPKGAVTVSLGYTTNNHRYEKMVDLADKAMYYAKSHGKNQYKCYEEMED